MRNVIVGAALIALCGTVPETPASRLEAGVSEVSLQTCKRVEGPDVGSLPLEVELAGKTIRFAEWTTADELSTEVVGFAVRLPAGVTFTVEAGDRTFDGAAPRWLHPDGVSGPRVHGIDALTFCTQARQPAIAQR
jgi:hypothetical protein